MSDTGTVGTHDDQAVTWTRDGTARSDPAVSSLEQVFGEESNHRNKQRRLSQDTIVMSGTTDTASIASASGTLSIAEAPPTTWQPVGKYLQLVQRRPFHPFAGTQCTYSHTHNIASLPVHDSSL